MGCLSITGLFPAVSFQYSIIHLGSLFTGRPLFSLKQGFERTYGNKKPRASRSLSCARLVFAHTKLSMNRLTPYFLQSFERDKETSFLSKETKRPKLAHQSNFEQRNRENRVCSCSPTTLPPSPFQSRDLKMRRRRRKRKRCLKSEFAFLQPS